MKVLLFYICCNLWVVIATTSCTNSTGLPPLNETYSRKDKNPFGTYVVRNQLEQLFYQNSINDIRQNFETTWKESEDTAALYVNVSRNLYLTNKDVAGMLEFVAAGNTLFLASSLFDNALLDTLGCQVNRGYIDEFAPVMKFTGVKFAPLIQADTALYGYYYLPFYSHFNKVNKLQTVVLGTNQQGANFIVIFYGKGRFYLHTEPRALSNYFLLQKDNYKYIRQLFSFTMNVPEHIYWDDYYNKRNYPAQQNNKSGLAVLLQYPAMAWAFWLSLLLLLLYVLFAGKRRQRIVHTLPANTNTTVAFTETIGRLYLQQKDNRNIADKQITYLMEHIRNQYYLNTSLVNEEFLSTLSRKASSSKQGISQLFYAITAVQQQQQISDAELLNLNQLTEKFYKNNL